MSSQSCSSSTFNSGQSCPTFHVECLAKLCRICGVISKGYSYDVKSDSSPINMAFNLNVEINQPFVDLERVCNTWYSTVHNYIKRGSKPNIDGLLWNVHSGKGCQTCVRAVGKGRGGRPSKKKAPGRAKMGEVPKSSSEYTVSDLLKLDASKPIPPDIEKCVSHIMNIKMKQSTLPNRTIGIVSAGPHPLTLTPLCIARKESTEISKRMLRARTKQSTEIVKMISDESQNFSPKLQQLLEVSTRYPGRK